MNKAAGKAYKVMYQAQTWARAKVECETNGASLAVPKSQVTTTYISKQYLLVCLELTSSNPMCTAVLLLGRLK